MPNLEVITKNESLLKWQNTTKTGASVIILPFTSGGFRANVNRSIIDVVTDAGAFSHFKKTQDPETSFSVNARYRDRLGALLGNAAGGFEEKDAGKSCAHGTMTIESVSGGITDLIQVPNLTLMGYVLSSAREGVSIELQLAGVGEPTFAGASISGTTATATNAETMVQAETYVRWKGSKTSVTASVAKTLGFIEGGWRLAVNFRKTAIRNNAGQFSHWKTLGDPTWALSLNKLYQDYATELLNDSQDGFNTREPTTRSVPYGTIAVEGNFAGSGLESIQFTNATLKGWSPSPGENGNMLELNFAGVGNPTFASATLS